MIAWLEGALPKSRELKMGRGLQRPCKVALERKQLMGTCATSRGQVRPSFFCLLWVLDPGEWGMGENGVKKWELPQSLPFRLLSLR